MPTDENLTPITDQEEFDLEQLELAAKGQTEGNVQLTDAEIAVQKEATRKGWVPKEKFTGEDWVDAATFIDRGKKFNINLQNRLANTEAELARFKKTAEQFKVFHEESMVRKDAELSSAIKQLRTERSEAIREGDDDKANVIEDRIDVLKEEQRVAKIPPESEAPARDPALEEWIADGNDWFTKDIKLQSYAVTLGQELIANGEKARGREFLDKVTAMMKEEFPAKFGNPLRNRPNATEGGGGGGLNGAGGNSERDLPRVDRELMNQFIAEGWTTKEKFLKDYFAR